MTITQSLVEARSLCAKVSGIRVVERGNGTVIDIATPIVRASVALQGAHVLSWVPKGQTDLLWVSPLSKLGGGKAIRGGIPICWPWFGPHTTDSTQPQHGLARIADWSIVDAMHDQKGVTLEFTLPSDASPVPGLALPLAVTFRATFGAELSLVLSTRNYGLEPIALTTALHTYFRVANASRARVDGLDGATYRDNADAGRTKRQFGTLHLERETIALFDTAPSVQTLTDPVLRRWITIQRHGGMSTVVWNPGANAVSMADIAPGGSAEFVCVESGAIGQSSVTILSGATHHLFATYAVTSF